MVKTTNLFHNHRNFDLMKIAALLHVFGDFNDITGTKPWKNRGKSYIFCLTTATYLKHMENNTCSNYLKEYMNLYIVWEKINFYFYI